jgi:CDP-paratose 2-epimerase
MDLVPWEEMMRVLVTGGCGLIGFNAAKYYREQGHDVDVMDNLERSDLLGHSVSEERRTFNSYALKGLGVNVFHHDVSMRTDWIQHDGHDLILHFAGQCGVPTSIDNPRRDFEVNCMGTFNALEYAREHDATLCFASTNKVYPIHDAFVFDEKDDRWHFTKHCWDALGVGLNAINEVGSRTPYGAGKYAADLYCQEYAHTYGVKTGVFRMSCIYGPNQFGFAEQGWAVWFIFAALKGLPLTIFGDGKQVRDMLYVEDCVKAYDAFHKSDLDHGVFNLGGGLDNTLSLMECIDMLEDMTGKRIEYSFDDWRPSDQKTYISDIRPAIVKLGWEPTVDPRTGLEASMDWVKENLDLF